MEGGGEGDGGRRGGGWKKRPRTGEKVMACRNMTYLIDRRGWEKKAGKKN